MAKDFKELGFTSSGYLIEDTRTGQRIEFPTYDEAFEYMHNFKLEEPNKYEGE